MLLRAALHKQMHNCTQNRSQTCKWQGKARQQGWARYHFKISGACLNVVESHDELVLAFLTREL